MRRTKIGYTEERTQIYREESHNSKMSEEFVPRKSSREKMFEEREKRWRVSSICCPTRFKTHFNCFSRLSFALVFCLLKTNHAPRNHRRREAFVKKAKVRVPNSETDSETDSKTDNETDPGNCQSRETERERERERDPW